MNFQLLERISYCRAVGDVSSEFQPARDATKAMVASDMADSAIIRSLALMVSGNVPAGGKSRCNCDMGTESNLISESSIA
jgi:hypothetical protein